MKRSHSKPRYRFARQRSDIPTRKIILFRLGCGAHAERSNKWIVAEMLLCAIESTAPKFQGVWQTVLRSTHDSACPSACSPDRRDLLSAWPKHSEKMRSVILMRSLAALPLITALRETEGQDE